MIFIKCYKLANWSKEIAKENIISHHDRPKQNNFTHMQVDFVICTCKFVQSYFDGGIYFYPGLLSSLWTTLTFVLIQWPSPCIVLIQWPSPCILFLGLASFFDANQNLVCSLFSFNYWCIFSLFSLSSGFSR